MNSTTARYAGLLLHITSLPSPHGIGDLGQGAYRLVDWMEEAAFNLWQILPTGPTGYGNSPYAPRSSFAANELFIDLHQLVEAGYLEARALDHVPSFREDRVDFPSVTAFKMPHLKAAALAFIRAGHTERGPYRAFCTAQRFWLDDYALFRTIAEEWGDSRWMSHWSRELGQRDATALRRFTDEHRQEIEVWRVLQYFFDVQWKKLKAYVNARGIRLIGDVPIFVASDSSDTWQHPHLFKRNAEGVFDPVSGVPPDIFSATGQLWGNPVYDWPVHRASGYQWWIERMKRLFSLTDMVRVDHFRGFEATYEIPADHVTAEFGAWVKADGDGLFQAIESKLGHLEIIAEDLGLMNDEVLALRDGHNFPGMKIFQFGFTTTETGEPNYHDDFLPHNWGERFVAYTGTHDNNTTLGWYRSLSKKEQRMVRAYLNCRSDAVVPAMIRALMLSHARTAIILMQDLLKKGEEARFNYPSSCNDENWSWRVKGDELSPALARQVARLVTISSRDGRVVPSIN